MFLTYWLYETQVSLNNMKQFMFSHFLTVTYITTTTPILDAKVYQRDQNGKQQCLNTIKYVGMRKRYNHFLNSETFLKFISPW
jgi:hypothetical protein